MEVLRGGKPAIVLGLYRPSPESTVLEGITGFRFASELLVGFLICELCKLVSDFTSNVEFTC